MIVIGIDPGQFGGVAVLKPDRSIIETIPMPTKKDPAGVGDSSVSVDFHYLYGFLGKYEFDNPIVIIEKVRNLPRVASKTTFKFGRNYESCVNAAEGWGYPTTYVSPKNWQSHFFDGAQVKFKDSKKKVRDIKAMSLTAAKKIWRRPTTQNAYFYRQYTGKKPETAVPHDGIVDALLLAYWGIKHVVEKHRHPYARIVVDNPKIFKTEKKKKILDGYIPS